MSEEVLDIKRWGNSLGLRIPSAIAKKARLHENSRVRITVEKNHVVITEIKNRDLSLKEKLALRHGLSLASLDEDLMKAAEKSGVKRFVP